MGLYPREPAQRYALHRRDRGSGAAYPAASRGAGSGFARHYGIRRLVYAEPHAEIATAIAREKSLNRWRRDWKIALIEAGNPDWQDLWESIQA